MHFRGFTKSPEAVTAISDTTDEWYRHRLRGIEKEPQKYPDWKVENGRTYLHKFDEFADPLLPDLEAWKLVLPRELREAVIRENHDAPQAGHLGIEKTYSRIALLYYWPGMYKDVTDYVRACETCQKCKVEQMRPRGLMGNRVNEQPWVAVAVDVMGPFPPNKQGFMYVLVIQDLFTFVRYVRLTRLQY